MAPELRAPGRVRRHRHRKKRKGNPLRNIRWWHLAAAVAVSAAGIGLAVLVLRERLPGQ